MPSHLTRVVFRSIIANKPVLYRGCLQRTSRPRIAFQHGSCVITHSQRRTFLNLFKPERFVKPADLPTGLGKMMEYQQMVSIKARPPPPEEVAKAFVAFVSRNRTKNEDNHIQTALLSFKYLQEHPRRDGKPWLTLPQLRQTMAQLTREPDVPGNAHLSLARLVHDEIKRRRDAASDDVLAQNQQEYKNTDCIQFIRLLCQNGATVEARQLLQSVYTGDEVSSKQNKEGWVYVIKGFAREDSRDELVKSVKKLRELSIPFTPKIQKVLVRYFVKKGDLEQAKRWYIEPVEHQSKAVEPSEGSHSAILTGCALAGDHAFGQKVIANLLKDMPSKLEWDAIFLWSAAIGKGVDEVERMMKVMVRRSEELQKKTGQEVIRPDIDTINTLVEFAISRKDPYTAERYIALGERWGIPPSAKTFVMQMDYRLAANDIDGARTAYFGLQGEKIQEENAPAVNKLVQAMCNAKRYPFDDIMAIVDDLQERRLPFTPETVACLCLQHLRRGEAYDSADLLQTHAHHFSLKQRAYIRDQLVGFCQDRQNSTAEAWDTYSIIHNVFKETPREIRTKLMNEFFGRKRSDMGCHAFFHMRQNDNPDARATSDTYVHAFTGFARCKDAESLELVHNQLKLDLDTELDTRMRNALMLAYAAIGQNQRALEFWSEIVASKEGPTYNSIAIAFRSCEGMPFGDYFAKPIWQRLKEMDIEIDKEIFTAYLGALARNGLHDEALKMVATVKDEYGFAPDLFIVGNWFNATINVERQTKIEEWCKEHYPAAWAELEALGHFVTMEGFGYKQFNFNRELNP
ncbi:hypothetical protein GQ43DRAFT_441557 [Delitschia confertaspora ATCC 74209]|uniref:Pentatricopeptide repeat domain protein n=1 Tax=Delitschia confertaspora ATCC 74209 TaxID=1513339 RepID=A0A9P4JP51_9PLEO|nr:hypothetical protein GQ43DRAFT_441557 [Delitschia confertaspora ATCC 74209]